jgi:hypothetical protein
LNSYNLIFKMERKMKEITHTHIFVLLVAMFWPMMISEGAKEKSIGKIELTYIPPFGTNDDLRGKVLGVDPNGYSVAVYIYVSGWWTKPYMNQPLTPIAGDGTWTCDITTGGIDQYATQIIAFLVPNGYQPPLEQGGQCLPFDVYQNSYAKAIRYEKISFAGYNWWVKRHYERVGPGPNYFSSSQENVWVDPNGYLHLKIIQKDGKWYCSEAIADGSFGYGTYIFTIQGRIDLLDENIVLGLFTWEDCVPQYHYREIDIELSRWGNPKNDNAQFVVQPWDTPGNMIRFNVDLAAGPNETTQIFTWCHNSIRFRSYLGNFCIVPPTENIVSSWSYTGNDLPPHGGENPRINFWLINGNAPNNGQDAEIVIKSFKYLPDTAAAIDLFDFALFAAYWLETDCDVCGGADLTGDGNVSLNDLNRLVGKWLVDVE